MVNLAQHRDRSSHRHQPRSMVNSVGQPALGERSHPCDASNKRLLREGHPLEALQQCEAALAINPHRVENWCDRAEVLACLNRYEEALDNVEQAQELAGFSDPNIWLQKATILILLARYQEALSCCRYVLQRHANHLQAWLFQGVALQRMGHYQEAYRSYRQVITLTQKTVQATAKTAP